MTYGPVSYECFGSRKEVVEDQQDQPVLHLLFSRSDLGGVDEAFIAKLVGGLQWHWIAGKMPELGYKGLPIRAKIKTNGFYFGFSYRP